MTTAKYQGRIYAAEKENFKSRLPKVIRCPGVENVIKSLKSNNVCGFESFNYSN